MKNFYYFIFKVVGILLIIFSIPLGLFFYYGRSLCGLSYTPPLGCSFGYALVLIPIATLIIGLISNHFAKRFKK